MANEKFKVNYGLAVGDTAATIDATTGDIVTQGDIELGGNTIKKSGGTPVIEFSGTNLTTLSGDLEIDGNSILSSTGATAIELNGSDITTGDITLNGGDIRSNGGTVAISVSSNNTTFAGDITINGGDIRSNGGTIALSVSGADAIVAGDLQISGNDIKSSIGTPAIILSGQNVSVVGDLTVLGNNIKSSTGSTAMTMSGTDVIMANDITINGGDIRSNGGTVAISVSSNNTTFANDITINGGDIRAVGDEPAIQLLGAGDVAISGDLRVNGNEIISSTGATAITMSGVDVVVAGDLTVTGNDIKSATGNTAITMSNTDVIVAGDLQISGSDIKGPGGVQAIRLDTGNVTVAGFLEIDGNTIRSSAGASTITMTTAGDVAIAGDLTVTGNDIKGITGITAITMIAPDIRGARDIIATRDFQTDSGVLRTGVTTASLFNTNATTVNIAGAGTTVSIGANTGTTTINNSLVADDISIATIDATNIEVTNIKAKDGTAAATIADTTGIITVSTELNVDNINLSGNTISSTDTNGAINLTPNGTGVVVIPTADITNLDVTNIRALDGTAAATIANTTGVITVSTELNVDNINISGNTIISTDTNGNITLTPNGTGDVVTSKNYVRGAIRNATADANGVIWYLNTSTLTAPYTGVSIDNSPSTATQSALLLRNYTGNNTAASIGNRARVILEKARNTVASPAALAIGDLMGEISATGYTSTGWVNDLYSVSPGFFGFNAAENWVANTNLGTGFNLALAPTATTINTGADVVNCITVNPQTLALRSDTHALMQGKTVGFIATGCSISGTTLTIGTVTTGAVAIGQMIQNAGLSINTACYIVSGSGSTWTLSFAPGNQTGQTITGRAGFISAVSGYTSIINNLRLGTNIITNSANQTQVVLSTNAATLELRGDNIQLENAAGTNIIGSSITYNRVYGQWEQDGPVNPVAANTSYVFPIGTAIDTNIATVVSTSRITPGAAGKYNLQFSLQWANADNTEHTFYVWLRKNGVNVANSTGEVTCLKSAKGISGWNYIISSANATDYWELAYQVTDVDVTFPYVAAFGTAPDDVPACPALITTLTPVGA